MTVSKCGWVKLKKGASSSIILLGKAEIELL